MNNHTRELLKECDSGTKMAVGSFKEVIDRISDSRLRQLIGDCLGEHECISEEIRRTLDTSGEEGKEPAAMAKLMTWAKINMKMLEKADDKNIAHLMYDGCSMGVKQLSEYLNEYTQADVAAKALAGRLIELEERLAERLKEFL